MDDDNSSSSSFQRAVILRDWWLIKCSNEFEGKRFGVAGIEGSISSDSFKHRKRALRVFTSSPIIKSFDVFTLVASDGTCITLQGFINKERVVKCGFSPEILREFLFGFPPCWEKFCNNWFKGEEPKGCNPILTPCDVEGNLSESGVKSTVTENNDEDGCGGGSRAREKKTTRRKALCLQLSYGGVREEEEGRVELSKGGDHGSEGLDNGKSDENQVQSGTNDGAHGNVVSSGGECEFEAVDNVVISPGYGRKHSGADNVPSTDATGEQRKEELKVTRAALPPESNKSSKHGKKENLKKRKKSRKSDGNVVEPVKYLRSKVGRAENGRILEGCESLNKAKSVDVEKDGGQAINDEVISLVDRCSKRHSGIANVEKITSEHPIRESLTTEQQKGKLKTHSLVKGSDNNSKSRKRGRPKKSEKTLKSDRKVVEPMCNTGSKRKEAKETMSWEKTRRKIDFDVEVSPEKKAKRQKSVFDFEVTPVKKTPGKKVKKQETSADYTGSISQRRSRSGRALVSPLEFWRNQLPVYDKERNIIQVKESDDETPFKGKVSRSRKPRR